MALLLLAISNVVATYSEIWRNLALISALRTISQSSLPRRRLRRHKVEEHTRHKVEEHTRHHVGVCTSLPLNPSFRQLLSTLYTCLADKFLVSHVIQPHQVQNVGRWTSVEGAMDRQQFFARPPAWRRLACTWRRKNLERIRGCFHMVANLHAIVGSEARDKCV
ncbi:hypothetical protein EV401DRAFT_1552248 [Pisolithus croceorrhizus]|nr:hypothetical protein EV401DRAFT_1552248 [Pisolithus croceorrhizus]